MKSGRCCLLGLLATLSLTQPAQAQRPRPKEELVDQVKKAIADGITYLRQIEDGKGNWEHTTSIARGQPGGVTALAVVALLNCGVSKDDPLIQRALNYLRTIRPQHSYCVGLQTMAFCLAGEQQDRPRILTNLKWIKDNESSGGRGNEVGWDYTGRGTPDHSINQYILLGINEARVAGHPVDEPLLKLLRDYYNTSHTDGTWGYRSMKRASLTMTTAGLCNLLITGLDLPSNKSVLKEDGSSENCGVYPEEATVRKSLKWIGAHFGAQANDGFRVFPSPFYTLYGIERAGRLTGHRFLGNQDWYRVGCEYLVRTQKNGRWEVSEWATGNIPNLDRWPPVATSLALLFLSKGRTPVLISKLAHGRTEDNLKDTEVADWNRKRNDARNLVEFASKTLFRGQPLAWQVFDIRKLRDIKPERLAEELLQSPILYINGHDLNLTLFERETELLKAYINNGGFIFAEACCGSEDFTKRFRELIEKISESKEGLKVLDTNHPVWNAEFEVDPRFCKLEGLNQGCKTVVIFSPQPLSGWWNNNDHTSNKGKSAFHLAANVIAYATGKELPKPRLTRFEIVGDQDVKKPPRGYLQVAQLVHQKDAKPLAPKAMRVAMQEVRKLNLEVNLQPRILTLTSTGDQSDPRNLLNYKFFYMHDRNGFAIPPKENLKDLKFTLENGGLLLADAACGSTQFDESFRELMKALWPDKKLERIDVQANQAKNELFSKEVNGVAIDTVKYRLRDEKSKKVDRDFTVGPPLLEGIRINGRWVVIYSKLDIGCALEKHHTPDCVGHDHDSAKLLARAVVLYALRR